ncbi:MAG: hypothetical protein H6603_08170 [Flavobacteriales bacterium]|nr:hypothetical protein [Flavobacteriales bacterium]
MIEGNRIVNGLWIGPRLSLLERLTIKSFVDNGHEFRLWCYGKLEEDVPNGSFLMNANDILDESRVFRYRNRNQFGHGKGSVSGFSDIFRYKLLHDLGGWWVDMDVTCLKPLDFSAPYYFRAHHELPLVGNVMKAPKGCTLMQHCFEQASAGVTENNTDWHKPITILAENVETLKLKEHVQSEHSTTDQWDVLRRYLYTNEPLPESWFYVHWMNEEWRTRGLDKYDFRIGSAYFLRLVQHGLVENDFTGFNRWKNNVRFTIKRFLG